jgi:hypothetical protein
VNFGLPIVDPLECLAFVAAWTTTILLGTGVLLPFHHPVVLAKRLATIDVLSSGRMRLFTIGVSSLPGEAAAVGVEWATRGRRADEAIDVLRALWGGRRRRHEFRRRVLLVRERDQFSQACRTVPSAAGSHHHSFCIKRIYPERTVVPLKPRGQSARSWARETGWPRRSPHAAPKCAGRARARVRRANIARAR